MSRCFSYPPPGYTGNKGSNQALIESIKLQRERELAKSERKKEKKREKKEKKKEKKERTKQKIGLDEKTKKVDKSLEALKSGYPQKVREDETEQLEKSSLTEEHEQPIYAQNPSSSSDSTQSSKRKRQLPPPVVKQNNNEICGHGNGIKIILSSRKPKLPDPSVGRKETCSTSGRDPLVGREEPCSTSGRIELLTPRKHGASSGGVQENLFPTPQGNNSVTRMLPPRPDTELVCSISGKSEAVSGKDNRTGPSHKVPAKLSKDELKYRDLIQNWIPPPLQAEPEFDDEDWLFSRKNGDSQVQKKLKASHNVSCGSSSSSLWPCAQFLPKADVYALPYTIPF